ncbi:MAG TPA: alanine racemase [Symbiobacteriaceae bacterium]|jgi:alanine racemase
MDLDRVRATQAEVDLDAIAHNVRALMQMAPAAQFMAVVKADGYGHGVLPVTRTVLAAGATWLGVATVEEGVQLAEAGLTAPTLILGGLVPPAMADVVVNWNLRTALWDMNLAEALSRAAQAAGRKAPVHLKIDTGMSRVGSRPHEAVAFAKAVSALPGIDVEGVFTHLAAADEPENDFAARQLAAFGAVLNALAAAGIRPRVRHACNSAGIMLHPEGHYDLVRGGIAMYGLEPDPAVRWPVPLRPALTWRTRVAMVKTVEAGTPISYGCTYRTTRPERVATLPIGYADGYFRLLSNKGEVLIKGQRCPIAGRVCMDQFMVRLPDDLPVSVGDEAILIGRQGSEQITASDMARTIGTINYEVVCAIHKRVPRLYCKDGRLQNQAD